MAKRPKMWQRGQNGGWYVTIQGQQIPLGKPWKKDALVLRFKRLSQKIGTRVNAYAFRHGFATRALEQGVDSTTVAILMGHRDKTMLSRVYAHLDCNRDHLQAALQTIGAGDAV